MFAVQSWFPLLAIAVSWLAWRDPSPLLAWKDAVTPLLMLIMFLMGLTLRLQDFQRILNKPEPMATGVVLQFLVMPLAGWLLALGLDLPPELALGVILVGTCAGGTASNVITFLAGGDVALSVSMTLLSTLWSVILTPYLLAFYAGNQVHVDTGAMIMGLMQLIVVPIAAALAINHWQPELRKALHKYVADAATVAILAIIGIVVALNADEIGTLGITTLIAVALHNLIGLSGGYWLARWRGLTEAECRTIAIEVGMQNSGLGAALALKFFGPMSALPAAVFSVWHNLTGALLAGYWRWKTQQQIRTIRRQSSCSSHQPTADK